MAFDPRALAPALREAAPRGLASGVLARACPDATALFTPRGRSSFGELHRRANRLAHALRARGLRSGDAVALMCANRAEFVEVLLATQRIGVRLTPIATALTAGEARHIVADCQARWLFVEPGRGGDGLDLCEQVSIGSAGYEAFLGAGAADDPADAQAGSLMLYTSGTTGTPKGVFRPGPHVVAPQFEGSFAEYRAADVQLCAGPAYHAAPLLFDLRWPLASGVPIVMLEKWDSAEVLRTIEQHRVTHAHLVPTMFQRLLALPRAQRERHDVSSLRLILHGAAPCPVAVKRSMIDWFGPVITEYYAGTEGGEGIHIHSADWLAHPGAVGRLPAVHQLLDDELQPVPVGTPGRLWLRAADGAGFEYFGDAQKTLAAHHDGCYTLGDIGQVDADGWLTLTGRSAETIITGGVNVYPGEVDSALLRHPAVADVCTVGAPDPDWGEAVVAVVVAEPASAASDALAAALIEHAAALLAPFKRPRRIVFAQALPRTESGKLQRQRVRDGFWRDPGRSL